MMKKIILILFLILLNTIAEANEVKFQFKKSLMPNSYKLIIDNKSNRVVEFYGCYDSLEERTNYYLFMRNGTKHYFDSKIFCGIGMKGRYWVYEGNKGEIPFNIKKNLMKETAQIVFKGVTYIPVRTGAFVDSTDMRDLIVIYDVHINSVSFEIGKEVLKQPEFKSENGIIDHPRGMDINQINGVLSEEK